ncbi:sensor histidine kinase [Ferdinandcohnia quinoae]|uniref:histidine kinase n=1 Tax=Fredinandcohnia quinoae TaxID=2918902 RepID=A0AAW5E5B7_9BACI|nr:sensor histidine kinase [Fredinandcohnia sp. SECRCQ15]MCH1627538.1 sensor histidine kinase [Fredinandcohnia sp. SECRCQ15]
MKREWVWTDWFIFFLRLCWYITVLLNFIVENGTNMNSEDMRFIGILIVCYLVPHLFWRPGYLHTILYPLSEIILIGTALFYFNTIVEIELGSSLILMSLLMNGYLSTKQTAKWTYPIFIVLLPLPLLWSMDKVTYFMQYTEIFIFLGFGASFHYVVQSQQRTTRMLEENRTQYRLIVEQNRVLQQYAKQVENVTLLQERNRVAGELHDTIGHHFTSVTVGLDAVSYLIDSDIEKAKEKINRLADVSRKGLDEIRRNIHQIAPSENEELLSILLKQIASDFQVHTNTVVTFHVNGNETSVSKNSKLVLIRCLQEALTNAKRHGDATEISIEYIIRSHELSLLIKNNGHPLGSYEPGFGLKTMKERIEDLHGKIEITSGESQGVTLKIALPI